MDRKSACRSAVDRQREFADAWESVPDAIVATIVALAVSATTARYVASSLIAA